MTITATYGGSKTAVLTVTPNVAFLMNREEEMLLASDSREREEVGPDEEQATVEVATTPTANTSQEKTPAFKLASLWTLGRSPFADLFPVTLRVDADDGAIADDFGGSHSLMAGLFGNLGFGSETSTRAASARTPLVLTGSRYSFYTPEMNLMAETELTSNPTPVILYEYIWFGGQPVAQVDSAGVTSWTFTDHLGTPLIQTSSVQGITWRAEHEPYGKVFALRTPDQHQPLRLPGQEAEQLNLGPNGATERSYNIFRWYRNGWGRYTQGDPLGIHSAGSYAGANLLYGYADARPTALTDPLGLYVPTQGCTPEEHQKIQVAGGKAEAAAKTCLPCGEIPHEWALRIRHSVWHCDHRGGDGFCGIHGRPRPDYPFYDDTGHDISLGPGGLGESKFCGCLQAVMLHEVAHYFGYGHGGGKNAYDIEKPCLKCAAEKP